MEIIGPDYRAHAGVMIVYSWSLGYILYAVIAYYIRDWFTQNLVASGSTVIILVILL